MSLYDTDTNFFALRVKVIEEDDGQATKLLSFQGPGIINIEIISNIIDYRPSLTTQGLMKTEFGKFFISILNFIAEKANFAKICISHPSVNRARLYHTCTRRWTFKIWGKNRRPIGSSKLKEQHSIIPVHYNLPEPEDDPAAQHRAVKDPDNKLKSLLVEELTIK